MKEHKVEADVTAGNLLLIDDIPYITKKTITEKIDGITHLRKVIYKKASKEEISNAIEKIVNKLKGKTSKEELLRELVRSNYSMKTIMELNKEIDKNVKITKHKGCLGFKIGKKYIQLIR